MCPPVKPCRAVKSFTGKSGHEGKEVGSTVVQDNFLIIRFLWVWFGSTRTFRFRNPSFVRRGEVERAVGDTSTVMPDPTPHSSDRPCFPGVLSLTMK